MDLLVWPPLFSFPVRNPESFAGSDEPGTSACSGVVQQEKATFTCENVGFERSMLFASRVNDGAFS